MSTEETPQSRFTRIGASAGDSTPGPGDNGANAASASAAAPPVSGGAWGAWGGPATVIVYGDSGTGKSLDAAMAFPDGLFLCLPTALDATVNVAGFAVRRRYKIDTITQAIALVDAAAKLPEGKRPTAVIVDDLSILAEHEAQSMRDSGDYPQRGNGAFRFWMDLGDKVARLARSAAWAGMHVVFNAHTRAPSNDDDGFWQGGPQLPSKKLTRKIPHIASMVLRSGFAPDGERPEAPWRGIYRCEADPEWFMKNRYGLVGASLPMNLGELLRHAGFRVPRLAGLEWQESWVETLAGKLAAGVPAGDVKAKLKQAGRQRGYAPAHLRWTWRDGLDRFAIRQRQAAMDDF